MPLGGRNQRALLTLLLLRANEPVSTERLVDRALGRASAADCDDVPPEHVSQLRKLLGPGLLQTRPNGYVLALDRSQLDLAASRSCSRGARGRARASARACSARRSRSGAGRPLADSELEDFAQHEIHRLEDLRLAVLEDRIAADLELRSTPSSWPSWSRSSAGIRCGSGSAAQLMLALYRSGRQADALEVYHDARRTLVDELGIEPGPELQALYGSILRQERSLVPRRAPALEDHYDEVMRALVGRSARARARSRSRERRRRRARAAACGALRAEHGDRGLAYVSQAVAARNGIGPLHDELHLALDRDIEPSLLHTLARRPAAAAAATAGCPSN